MQVNGLSGAGSKTAGIKMAQKMDSFSINIKNEIVSICIPDEYFGNTKSKDC